MRSVIKLVIIGTAVLCLAMVAFCAGFGSGYLLADGDVLFGRSRVDATPSFSPSLSPPAGTALPSVEPTPTRMPVPTPRLEGGEDEETFQLFWEVWSLIEQHYYGELPDMKQVTYAAIRGMLSTLHDDYTAFMEPDFAAVLNEDATGEFEGIGAFVGLDEDGRLEIVSPFESGPAEAAGLQAGDRVLEVDGIPLAGKTLYESITLIRGPANSKVVLLIEREGVPEPFEVTVTRAKLEIPITEVEMLDHGIGYIRLYEFSGTASKLMNDGLRELLVQRPVGIILDLRENPGGWLDQAIEVADLFLDEGVVVVERWSDGSEQVFRSDDGDLAESVPLVVLVDRGSASASEIVAGALQDRQRAILIGESTFGKGSVQRPFTLSDGSELRVTVAHWFTPGGQAIHGLGLHPDIEVSQPEQPETEPYVDAQLQRAIDYLLTGE